MAAPSPSATNYPGTFSQVDTNAVGKANNTNSDMANLVLWYDHFHAEMSNGNPMGLNSIVSGGVTFADNWVGRGKSCCDYRNGSYLGQAGTSSLNFGETSDAETKIPLGIATFWGGNWATSHSAGGVTLQTTMNATDNTTAINVSQAVGSPTGAQIPNTWPFIYGEFYNDGDQSIDSIVLVSGTTYTFTVQNHGHSNGDSLNIKTCTPSGYNGTRVISNVAEDSFTMVVGSNPGAVSVLGKVTATSTWIKSTGRVKPAISTSVTSDETDAYVSWLRIGDEVMGLTVAPGTSGSNITLTVRRGMWGTTKATHAIGAKVYTPVYIGSVPTGADTALSGVPARQVPYALRYALKLWQGTPVPSSSSGVALTLGNTWNWIYDQIVREAGDVSPGNVPSRTDWYGEDTSHLDVSSSNRYNTSDGWGDDVELWDDPQSAIMTSSRWSAHQQTKVRGFRSIVNGGADIRTPKAFHVNSLDSADITQTFNQDLLTTVDAGVMEGWVKDPFTGSRPNSAYQDEMDTSLWAAANGAGLMHWMRWNRQPIPTSIPQYKRVAYACFLMAYRPNLTRFFVGGPWGATSNKINKPEPLFFYDFGTPDANYANSAALPTVATNCFKRTFDRSIVVVNCDTVSHSFTVPAGTWYRIANNDALSANASASGSISIPADEALFLVRDTSEVTSTLFGGLTIAMPIAFSAAADLSTLKVGC